MRPHAESLQTLLRFNCEMLHRIAADLPEDVLDQPIVQGANTPRWVLLHLAVGLDFALLAMGKPTLLPRQWLAQYGPRSSGQWHHPEPAKAELLAMVDAGVAAVQAALGDADFAAAPAFAERMARQHAAKALQGTALVTIGDTLAHLLTTHFALHIGQLSLARRKAGHAPVI